MHITKLGDDLVVRLSQTLIDQLDLKPGDTLAVIASSPGQIVVEKQSERAEAVARMAERKWVLPADYKFDRDEANER